MSSPSHRELEERLLGAGNSLLDPPSSDDELLSLLDQVESCLSNVEQSPTKSMHNALSPSLKALVTDKLLKHPNADVKVSVASCISEITRITAPEAPYEDDPMKEIFQLIVSSFANLSDKSSRSYKKRVSILETVSKVRSCVLMLDLECDALILEMFGHFFKTIRDDHTDNVFSSMETIMTLVLEESEDISQELLSPILACMKKDNKEILPIARKLGEKVLESSAAKVKPYLIQAVNSLGIPLKDYSPVVVSICDQETSSAVEKVYGHAAAGKTADESKLEMPSLHSVAEVDKDITKEEASPELVDPDIKKSPNSVGSNGITQTGEDDSFLDSNCKEQEGTSKKEEDDHHADQLKCSNVLSKAELDNSTEKAVCKIDQTTKKRGRKSSASKSGPSDGSHSASKKESEELLASHKSDCKDDANSPREEPSIEAAAPSDIVKDIKSSVEAAVASDIVKETKPSIQAAVPSHAVKGIKAPESEPGNVSPPPPSGILEEGRARKVGRPKKVTSTKETMSVADVISNKASEATSDQEVKPAKRSGKKPATRVSNKDTSATIVTSTKESGAANDSEVKTLKVIETSSDNGDGSSLRHPVDDKKQGHVKAVVEKDVTESTDTDDKEVFSSLKSNTKSTKDGLEDTPQKNSKRKRTPVVEKGSGKEGEDLNGSKIKVWWPKDKKFYEGVVDSYDSVKKKHKVLYIDGDEEILNLSRQKWQLVECDSESDKGEGAGESSPDTSSDTPQKKKVKANSDLSAKPANSSSKRGGGTSSSKGKGTGRKPGRKPKFDDSADKATPKSGSKSKAPNKSNSKDVEVTPKSSSNSKQGAQNKSRGNSSKVKSGSAKIKEVEDASSDSEARESVQLKSSKGKGSETKTGKKRQRGARS